MASFCEFFAIVYSVHDTTPALILIFGPYDPSGASSLPADAVTCAALGAHALSALTAIHVQDTAGTEEIHLLAPELIDDQARCLLEDMSVQAIKMGPLYTMESISVLAQIKADYSHVPLVLHLGPVPDEAILEDGDTEEVLSALFQLLLPQADLVVAEYSLLAQWQSEGLLSGGLSTPVQALLAHGAQWVLTSGTPLRAGHDVYFLQGPENQTLNWAWRPSAARPVHVDGLLGCAATIQLAQGRQMPEAVEQAIKQAIELGARAFQPGMGQKLINRSRT